MLRINKMIKQVLLYFFTTILPVLSSPWFCLGVCFIAFVYNDRVSAWFVVFIWTSLFFRLIDNYELFRGTGLDSRFVVNFACDPSNPLDTITRRQKIYRLLKETAKMVGYPNCSIKFESERKDGNLFHMTYRIPNRNVYNAIDKFFSEIKEEKTYVR